MKKSDHKVSVRVNLEEVRVNNYPNEQELALLLHDYAEMLLQLPYRERSRETCTYLFCLLMFKHLTNLETPTSFNRMLEWKEEIVENGVFFDVFSMFEQSTLDKVYTEVKHIHKGRYVHIRDTFSTDQLLDMYNDYKNLHTQFNDNEYHLKAKLVIEQLLKKSQEVC